jgi:UDP-N-acetylglucosamine:LPS N-acetylglucosamine transferase
MNNLKMPYADEQLKNARILARIGLVEILPQEELSAKTLSRLVNKMAPNLGQYRKNSAKAQKLVKLDAAKRIVELVEKL